MTHRPIALVTGGSRGIGRAVVLRLAEAGYDVAFCCRSQSTASAGVEAIGADLGARVVAYYADVADPVAVTSVVRRVEDEVGPIDAAVTSAGITRDKSMLLMSDDDWTSVMRTNVDGTFYTCRAAMFGMLKRRHGSVVTLSSVAGRYGNPGQTNYSAAKAAVSAFTMSAAKEVGRYGVRVNAVAPGFIQTDMTENLPEKVLKEALPRIPLQRTGTASEVADLIEFLVSDRASYVTGQIIGIDGGLVL